MANFIIETFRRKHPEEFKEKSDTWVWEKLKNPITLKKYFPEFKDIDNRALLTEIKTTVDPTIKIEKYLPKLELPKIEIAEVDYLKFEKELEKLKKEEEISLEEFETLRKTALAKAKRPKKTIVNYPELEKRLDIKTKVGLTPDEISDLQESAEAAALPLFALELTTIDSRKKERDIEIYNKIKDKRLKKRFWKQRETKLSTMSDVGNAFATSFADGFGIPTGFNPNKKIYGLSSFTGNVAGFVTSLALLKPIAARAVASVFTGVKKLAFLSPKITRWLIGASTSGMTWAMKGMAGETFKQIDTGKIKPLDILLKGGEEFGFGWLLKGLPVGKRIAKHLLATGVSGGWGIFWALQKKGHLAKEDIFEIGTLMAIANLSQLSKVGYDKTIYNAFKNVKMEKTIKTRLLNILRKGKPMPKEAQNDLIGMVTKGGLSKDGKTQIENVADLSLRNFFGKEYTKLTRKARLRFANYFASKWQIYTERGNKNALDLAVKDVRGQLSKAKQYDRLVFVSKNYVSTFWNKFKKTRSLNKSFKDTKDITQKFITERKLGINIREFEPIDNMIKNRIRNLIGKEKIRITKADINELFEKDPRPFIKSFKEALKKLRIELKERFKNALAMAEEKSDELKLKEFTARQNVLKSTFKTAIERLKLKKETAKVYINEYNKQVSQTVKRYRDNVRLVKEGIADPRKVREFSPMKMVTKLERADEVFKKAYKESGKQLYQTLEGFNKLGKKFKEAVLQRTFLGEIFKGKGVLEQRRGIRDVGELKKFLPFLTAEDIREINEGVKVALNIRLPSKMAKAGIFVRYFQAPWYTLPKYGLASIEDKMTLAMKDKLMEVGTKEVLLRNLFSGLRKQTKKLGLDFMKSKERIWNFMDGKFTIKLRPGLTWERVKKAKILNKFEFDIAVQLRKETQEMFKRLNFFRNLSGQTPILKVSDYITHIIKPQVLNEFMTTGHIPPEIAKALKYMPRGKQFLRTAVHRVDKMMDDNLVKDIEGVMRAMYAIDLKWVYTQRAILRLKPLEYIVTDSSKYANTVKRFTDFLLNRFAGRPAAIDEHFNDTIEWLVAKPLRAMGMKIPARPLPWFANAMSSLGHLSALGFRGKFFIRNVGGQGFSVMAMYGATPFRFGVQNLKSKLGKQILDRVPEYAIRFPMEAGEKAMMSKFFKGLFKYGYAPITASDKINVKLAILASFHRGVRIFGFKGNIIKGLKKGLVPKNIFDKAVNYAAKEFRITQWSYLRHNLPPIMQTDTGRMALMFSSWTLNNWFVRIPELAKRFAVGKDFLGNKLPLWDRLAAVRFTLWGAAAIGTKQTSISFMYYLWRQQMFTTLPTPFPNLKWTYHLAQGTALSMMGYEKAAADNFYAAKMSARGMIPYWMTIDDIVKVTRTKNQKPLAHLFLYQYDEKGKERTPEQIMKNKYRNYLKELKDLRNSGLPETHQKILKRRMRIEYNRDVRLYKRQIELKKRVEERTR